MSHEVEQAVYGNSTPAWHELGLVKNGTLTGQEAMVLGGLDYESLESKVYDQWGNEVPYRKIIVRSTDHRHLGIVSNEYVPIHNREMFAFLDAVVGQLGEAHYDAAGCLKNGEIAFANIDLHKVFEVVSGDPIKRYLGASLGHNGKWGFRMAQIDCRQVCWNTVQAAWSEMQGGMHFLFHHRGHVRDYIEEARKAVGLALKDADASIELYARLAQVNYSEEQLLDYVNKVFPIPMVKAERHAKSTQAQYEWLRQFQITARAKVLELTETGLGTDIPGVKGTWYGAYNAVAEWCDHDLKATGVERAEVCLFGSRAQTKAAAYSLALNEVRA